MDSDHTCSAVISLHSALKKKKVSFPEIQEYFGGMDFFYFFELDLKVAQVAAYITTDGLYNNKDSTSFPVYFSCFKSSGKHS